MPVRGMMQFPSPKKLVSRMAQFGTVTWFTMRQSMLKRRGRSNQAPPPSPWWPATCTHSEPAQRCSSTAVVWCCGYLRPGARWTADGTRLIFIFCFLRHATPSLIRRWAGLQITGPKRGFPTKGTRLIHLPSLHECAKCLNAALGYLRICEIHSMRDGTLKIHPNGSSKRSSLILN